MKKRILSMLLTICMLATVISSISTASYAATNIAIGDYIQMGVYNGNPILWRCVDIDENGPLILSDKAICSKEFDNSGSNIESSHSRGYDNGYNRKKFGSNYWGDSNIRCWLNSKEQYGQVVWACGNVPTYKSEEGFLNAFTTQELSMIKKVSQKSLIDGNEYVDISNYGQEAHRYNENVENVIQNFDYSYSETFTDYIFLLDVNQLYNVYCNLGDYYKTTFADFGSSVAGEECIYWLRTPFCDDYKYSSSDNIVRCVYPDGKILFHHAYYSSVDDCDIGIRPAFYLNNNMSDFAFGNGSKSSPFRITDIIKESPKKFYAIYDDVMSWSEAKAKCEEMGGHLATISSVEEQNEIGKLLSNKKILRSYWLGGYKDTEWKWITNEDFSYTNWAQNEPNGGSNMVLQIFSPVCGYENMELKWDDTWNNGDKGGGIKQQGFICEWDNIKTNFSSNSTSSNAPIIKSVELAYKGKRYDIVNQKVTVDVGSNEKANLTVDIDFKSALKPRIYITQGADTDLNDGNGMSLSFNNTDGKFEDIILGQKLKPDLPVYIFVIDEMTGKSSSMRTKLNMVDLNADDDFKKAQGMGEIKIGKDMMLTIPEDVPIIGGTELTWQFDFLPVTMTCADDKMSFALGLDIADYNDGSDKDKKEGFDFKSFKETIDDYAKSLSEYDGNIADAYNEQKKSLSQIKKEVLSKSDLAKNKGLNMSVFDNKPFVNTGADKLGGGIEALGYVEVNKENGEWNWNGASGYLLFQVKVSYTYNGQAFFYVIPLCYSFGGEASAGFKGEVKGMSQEGYQPYIEAYLMAKLKLFVSGGVGIHKVAKFSAKADADLSFNYGLTDTAVKPDELLLDGSVGFFVEVLGQKVASLEVANLNDKYGVIYSTDPDKYDQSWIKPNKARSVSLMSINEQLGNYSANNVYENESRDYLANSMEWYGDMPPISLFAADYTNKNLTILADSVYPQAQPQIFSVGGKKILVFTADNDKRSANNKQMLVYSVYNDEDGTWSEAIPVNDDGTADFYPSVSGEYLVWQNQKSVMDDGLSFAEIGKQGEIVIAKWNGNGFDAPVSLTDNDTLDTLPKVSVNNNEISVVWLKNSANDILGVDGDTSIVKKVYNGSVWDEEIVLKDNLNSVTDLNVGYCENALNVAYVHDVDDDITTIDDREVYLISSSETQVTDNGVLDSNAIINNGKLYWYSENNIYFMNLADGVKSTVFEDARYALADGFTVSEDNGNIAILWSGSEDESSEIKGVLYQDGVWGDVITVSELGAYAKYPTCVLEEDGTILTSFTAETDGITSLYTLGLFPSYDLAISDIYFDEKNLALNSENEFEVLVTNNGELPVEGYTINVYNEDESLNNSIVFEDTIKAGESKAVVGNFITGDAISYETLRIEVVLNTNEEYVYDNNSITHSIGIGDISIENVSVYELLPSSIVNVDVSNKGYSTINDITVNLRSDRADGEIVKSIELISLLPGQNEKITFSYNPFEYENVKWYITVETEAEEVSVGNNSDYFINECAVGLEDYEISILNYSYANKQLTVNAFAMNNTNDSLVADAVFAVYSSDGKLKGITTQPLSVGGYSDTGIDVWFENYTYSSGDYVKMFMWKGLTNLKPLVNAEQVNVIIE